jgi:Domain of unknown function (DUF4279)
MAKPLIEVAMRLTGQGFAPEDVTKLVQLTPTRTWRLGDPVQRTQLKRKHDGWVFGLPQRETYEMDGLLRELLDAIEPHKEGIAEAAKRFGLEKETSLGVYVRGETPASWFAADTVHRISTLDASLDIDLMLMD